MEIINMHGSTIQRLERPFAMKKRRIFIGFSILHGEWKLNFPPGEWVYYIKQCVMKYEA